ncbi:hypothetical protein BMS3Abin16_01587 [archaeon BMS3Abin16]|nr:hypothetical protein BMS3Abin16_01587 [archaeon BMS3Abin16]HDY74243.1 hypothetical protein [Euryarchaeota archaeon]
MSENSPLDEQLTRDEYRILVDLVKHQHQRRQDFNRTFLTANTIIFGASAVMLQSESPLNSVLKLLGGLGILISLVWLLISERITLEADLRFFQLRGLEKRMGREEGIYTSGNRFFFQGSSLEDSESGERLVFPSGILGWKYRFRVAKVVRFLPMSFIVLYLALMTL